MIQKYSIVYLWLYRRSAEEPYWLSSHFLHTKDDHSKNISTIGFCCYHCVCIRPFIDYMIIISSMKRSKVCFCALISLCKNRVYCIIKSCVQHFESWVSVSMQTQNEVDCGGFCFQNLANDNLSYLEQNTKYYTASGTKANYSIFVF